MKNSKKFAAVFLTAAMVLSCMPYQAAASETGGVTFPLEEPVTMTMFAMSQADVALGDTLAMKKMEELTNVHWEIQSVPGADLFEKRNLLLNSNQYPDVFMKSALEDQALYDYGRQGIFIELDDSIDQYAPNLKKLLEERDGLDDICRSNDGHIYGLPEVDPVNQANHNMYINQVWLNNLGLEMPKSLDEFYNVLVAFKEQDANGNGDPNDEIPLICSVSTPITDLYPWFGIENHQDVCLVDGELTYIATSDQFKEFLRFANKLYSEGLLEENSFTNTYDRQRALGVADDIIGCFFDADGYLTVGTEKVEDYPYVLPFEDGVFPIMAGAWNGTFAITDHCEYPEIALAWVDYLYSEEGGKLAWFGVEGESYEIDENGKLSWILGEYSDVAELAPHALIQGASNHPGIQPEILEDVVTDPVDVISVQCRRDMTAKGAEIFPILRYSIEDGKTVSNIAADVNPYISQYIAQVTTGVLDLDDSWDEFNDKLIQMGVDKLMEIYTAAYEAKKK